MFQIETVRKKAQDRLPEEHFQPGSRHQMLRRTFARPAFPRAVAAPTCVAALTALLAFMESEMARPGSVFSTTTTY